MVHSQLNVDVLVSGYTQGFFPMADWDGIYWHSPDPRAIIPLNKVPDKPRSLKQYEKKHNYQFTINYDFEQVIKQCAERKDTWISEEIINSYIELNFIGLAHSIETWCEGEIVGGLYGVCIGAAFFGESMFNVKDNAAKSAYYHLIQLLNKNNFLLLDSQYINQFTRTLGAIEIPRNEYIELLTKAISESRKFI